MSRQSRSGAGDPIRRIHGLAHPTISALPRRNSSCRSGRLTASTHRAYRARVRWRSPAGPRPSGNRCRCGSRPDRVALGQLTPVRAVKRAHPAQHGGEQGVPRAEVVRGGPRGKAGLDVDRPVRQTTQPVRPEDLDRGIGQTLLPSRHPPRRPHYSCSDLSLRL